MLKPPYDIDALREQFPMLKRTVHGKPLIYLDTAATALKPQCVIDAITAFYTEGYGTVHRAIYSTAADSTARYNGVREQARAFLNAKSTSEIIFTKGTTDGINLLATVLGRGHLQAGDEVILSELEHHSNIVPWQFLEKEKGIVLKVIPANKNGELNLAVYKSLLSERTKLVSLAHVANSIGTIHPVEEIIRLAHAHGAYVLLDGAQAAPHLPVDVQALDVDFYVFSGHKAFGPTGIGILYGKEALLEELPPYQGGGDMIDHVGFDGSTYQRPPLKFEAGTPPIAQVIGLGAALEWIESIGRDKIAIWEHELLTYATERLKAVEGLTIVGTAPNKAAIISFVIDGVHPLDLGTMLDLNGIAVRTGHHCAQPALKLFNVPATTRLSFAPFSTLEEVDTFLSTLITVLRKLHAPV